MEDPSTPALPRDFFDHYDALNLASMQLFNAVMGVDDNRIVMLLNKIESERTALVNTLQTWRPELRISA